MCIFESVYRVLTRPFSVSARHATNLTRHTDRQADTLPIRCQNTLRNSLQHPKNSQLLVKAKHNSSVYWKPLAASHDPPSPAGSPERQLACQLRAQLGRQGKFCSTHFSSQASMIYRVQASPSSPANQKIYSQVKQR